MKVRVKSLEIREKYDNSSDKRIYAVASFTYLDKIEVDVVNGKEYGIAYNSSNEDCVPGLLSIDENTTFNLCENIFSFISNNNSSTFTIDFTKTEDCSFLINGVKLIYE